MTVEEFALAQRNIVFEPNEGRSETLIADFLHVHDRTVGIPPVLATRID
jgi:hypothetical protein